MMDDIAGTFYTIAREEFGGHFTIMAFTTNYRAAFGTIMAADYQELRDEIARMPVGDTLEEAMEKALATRASL